MKRKGVLITLEGNEGCGKTTQTRLLADYLKRKGHRVYLTREPGGTPASDAIRQVLLDNRHKGMTGTTETLLYMASRAELVRHVIKPRLQRGEIILCDRWLDATVAYQGYGAGVDIAWIRSIGKLVTDGVTPDLTLFLDLPLAVGLRRAVSHKKADRMELKSAAFHRKVRRGYDAIAKAEPRRFKRLPVAEKDGVETVQAKIREAVDRVL